MQLEAEAFIDAVQTDAISAVWVLHAIFEDGVEALW